MTVGLPVWIKFLTSREMDDLPSEQLERWMLQLNRAQREYCGRVNGRARSILNATHELNRWLDDETREDIEDRFYELQVFKKI